MQTKIWILVAKWSDDTAGKAEGRAWEHELDRLEQPAGICSAGYCSRHPNRENI
jgi:hypothetical protein